MIYAIEHARGVSLYDAPSRAVALREARADYGRDGEPYREVDQVDWALSIWGPE